MTPKGRKAQYSDWITDDGCLLIRGWARDGFSDKQIAHNLGIAPPTLNEWKKRFPCISEAIKKGRMPVAYRVEEALYNRCEWRKVTEVTRSYSTDMEGNVTSRIRITETDRWIPPDTAAIIFASKNLMPNKFKDKPVPKEDEEVEDDGFIKALNSSAEELFSDGDDSAKVINNERS